MVLAINNVKVKKLLPFASFTFVVTKREYFLTSSQYFFLIAIGAQCINGKIDSNFVVVVVVLCPKF